MNQHVTIGSYEQQQRASAAAIRRRLVGKTAPVNYKPKPEQKDVIRPYLYPPLPEKKYVEPDAHVRLWHWYKLNKKAIDELIRVAFLNTPKQTPVIRPRRTMNEIVTEFLEQTGSEVTISQLIGTSRVSAVVRLRHRAIFAVRVERPDLSYPAIGRFFGGRDHTTILYAVRKIAREMGVEC